MAANTVQFRIHRRYGLQTDIYFPIKDDANDQLQTGVTFSAGDSKIFRQTAASTYIYTNTTNLPSEGVASSGFYTITLTAAELSAFTNENVMFLHVRKSSPSFQVIVIIDFLPTPANLEEIDAAKTNANNATLYLKQLNIRSSAGTAMLVESLDASDAFVCKSNASPGSGFVAVGNGAGSGMVGVGGISGNGILASGLSGLVCNASGGGSGIIAYAAGTGAGFYCQGSTALRAEGLGSAGRGFWTSGDGSGEGIFCQGGDNQADAFKTIALDSPGSGFVAVGSGDGTGVLFTGGDTGTGALVTAGSSGNGDGLDITGYGSGHGINSVGGTSGDGIQSTGSNGMRLASIGTPGDGLKITGSQAGHGIATSGGSGGGDGIRAFATAANGNGIEALGVGTGSGLDCTGGASSGHGINSVGGTSGDGIYSIGSNGMRLASTGTPGDGLKATGSQAGHGIATSGGSGGGDGIRAFATAADGNGIEAIGFGAGSGLDCTGGASSGHGINATKGTGGKDIDADEALDDQATRDSMYLAPSGGSPAANSVDDKLDDLATNQLKTTTSIDGVAYTDVMEIIMAMANGRFRIDFPSPGRTTFYKRDNTTTLFVIETTLEERTRI